MRHFDLVIIGSGSGNSIPDERFADQSIAMVERGTFGGTCLNVGCIPTKMFVHPADLAAEPEHAAGLGVDLRLSAVDWPAIRDRIFGRIDPISEGGRQWRAGNSNITLFSETARFVGSHTLQVGTETITADRFVIAAGSRPVLPDVPGLDTVPFHTSDTVMRLPALPESVVIIGGGYIAAEFSHVFSAFGSRVSVVLRGDRVLAQEDGEVSARFTELLRTRVDLRVNSTVRKVAADGAGGVVLTLKSPDGDQELGGAVVLVATGRRPNGDILGLEAAGVEVDEEGYVRVDEHQRTTASHIFALGDVCSPAQLKHVANHQARVVQHNLLHPDDLWSAQRDAVPHAVFGRPQVASVGLTEEEAIQRGLDYLVGRQDYGEVAFGWAMEDRQHFAKVIADRGTGLILGAHVIGPEASTLIQPVIQAMSFGQRAHDVARGQYWIHPALTEVIENALLALG